MPLLLKWLRLLILVLMKQHGVQFMLERIFILHGLNLTEFFYQSLQVKNFLVFFMTPLVLEGCSL